MTLGPARILQGSCSVPRSHVEWFAGQGNCKKSISPTQASFRELYLWGIGLNHAGFLDVDVYGGFLRAGIRLRSRLPEVEVAG
jgi:hypothetical protein